MKYLALLLGVAVAVSAHGQLLAPVDRTKQIDFSGKMLDEKSLKLNTLSPGLYTTKDAGVTGKRVRTSVVKTELRQTDELHLATRSQTILPQQNFAAKRAAPSGQILTETVQKPSTAPINKRVIDLSHAAGQAELKKQLNILP